jgi:ubiquinone biosynthesis protein
MGARIERAKRALYVTRVARRSGLFRVLREIGVVGERAPTAEGARNFRQALEELGTTYIKLGQLLSSRPDLLPDSHSSARRSPRPTPSPAYSIRSSTRLRCWRRIRWR